MTQVATLPQTQQPSLLAKVASRYNVDPNKMLSTLKATAFKGDVSNEQMMALLIVADQYGLNPWTKEIYAFPDRQNGIVPVIGVDGWARIINSHEQFDGMEFQQDDDSCTCIIYRKDRTHPTKVTEYMAECKRGNAGPWSSHPKRMLRHKAMIQCARLAFGFVGVYDQDEAERIVERDVTPEADHLPMSQPASRTEAVKDKLRSKKADTKAETIDQRTGEVIDHDDELLRDVETAEKNIADQAPTAMTYAQVEEKLRKATNEDDLAAAADLIQYVDSASLRDELGRLYKDKAAEFKQK
jgi:phage recombination protein Bet